jgi:hypothetical protein
LLFCYFVKYLPVKWLRMAMAGGSGWGTYVKEHSVGAKPGRAGGHWPDDRGELTS